MSNFEEKLKELNNTPDTTEEYDEKDIADNKTYAILSYIWILFLVPLFAAKESKFARFHANQGIVLAIVETVCAIIFSILARIPFIGWLFGIVDGLLGLCFILLMIVGILNANNGKAKELPIIGKFKILK